MNGHANGMIEGNVLIRASAGTGKTFSLATRFIRLMLFDDVDPARIVALTFSRAAAQEIYTALLKRLWKAAESPSGVDRERANLLARLSSDKVALIEKLGISWTPETFAGLLRKVVSVQHLGAIATLDSFILRLVGNFPVEMGFQRALEVLDPAGEKDEIDHAAKAILGRADDAEGFAKAFRAARKGSFSRTCAQALETMMEREGWRAFILAHPECKAWTAQTMADALGLCAFAGFPDASATQTAQVRDRVADKKAVEWLEKFQKHLASVKLGEDPVPSGNKIPLEFARAVVRHPGEPFVEHQKKGKDGTVEVERCDYPPEVFAAAHADLRCLADAFLRRQLEIVEAKIRLLGIIEKEYDAATRRAGKLTFQDFTQAAGDGANLDLDNLRFRFDSKLDHWALDEFQDTSEVQWQCLKALVESAASGGASQSRSLIVVGDLKQSIYTWRGGNDQPFKEAMSWPWFGTDKDGTVYGRIENNQISYRYGKRIADFINRVFGERNLRDGGLIPASCAAATNRWLSDDCWLKHIPECDERGVPKVQDYVKVVGARSEPDLKANDAVISALCRELASVWDARTKANSDESIGILVRRNEDGARVAECLRKEGIPVVWEGVNAVSDMPVVQAVLQLLRLAEHPEDTLAWETVSRLLPICGLLMPDAHSAAAVSARVAESLSRQGLARTLKDFCGLLGREENGLDGLSRARLRALVRMGVDYARRRAPDYGVDGFARFVAGTGMRECAASANAVRVLSIHRSKGLTLDRVFVPLFESEKTSLAAPTQASALFGKGHSWVLPHLSPDVAALNAETKAVLDEQRDARLLEHLRLYYVALTRSRKALYVVFSQEEHRGLLFRDVIAQAIGAREKRPSAGGTLLFEDGEPPAFEAAQGGGESRREWTHAVAAKRLQRRSPSRAGHAPGRTGGQPLTADALFGESYGAAARRGVEVHAAYAAIEWADAETAAQLPEAFRPAFVRPGAAASVWRERAYELVDGDCWETGQFDRVVFVGSGVDRVATIYDFKTNAREAGESEAAFAARMRTLYAPQMALYRQALSRLTGLVVERIGAQLLLEATGQAVPV